MGAGIAKTIKSKIPEAFKADLITGKGNVSKLGGYSFVTVSFKGHELTVVNAYTQEHWKGKGCKADYSAIKCVFKKYLLILMVKKLDIL